jgi:hypothetical protein
MPLSPSEVHCPCIGFSLNSWGGSLAAPRALCAQKCPSGASNRTHALRRKGRQPRREDSRNRKTGSIERPSLDNLRLMAVSSHRLTRSPVFILYRASHLPINPFRFAVPGQKTPKAQRAPAAPTLWAEGVPGLAIWNELFFGSERHVLRKVGSYAAFVLSYRVAGKTMRLTEIQELKKTTRKRILLLKR